jgi:hypothetical protein
MQSSKNSRQRTEGPQATAIPITYGKLYTRVSNLRGFLQNHLRANPLTVHAVFEVSEETQ